MSAASPPLGLTRPGVIAACLALCASVTAAACGSEGRAAFDEGPRPVPEQAPNDPADPGSLGPSAPGVDAAVAHGCDAIDIVFVVDISTSMQDESKNLIANFPRFVDVLDALRIHGKPVDYRIGVTDSTLTHVEKNMFTTVTKVGSDGALLRAKECGLPRPWVERSDADRRDRFACLADLPLSDSNGFEMPLGALAASVTTPSAGFLRADALLGVVVLSDEDDKTAAQVPLDQADDGCPLQASWARPVPEIVVALDKAKGGRRESWAAAVIAGPGPGDCTSGFGKACEARRLADFVKQAGSGGVFGSICDGDLRPALTRALETFGRACEAMPAPVR